MNTASSYLDFIASVATPSDHDRRQASNNREAIDSWLRNHMDAYRVFETGSWAHGTAAAPWSDVDYFASIPGPRPQDSTTALDKLRHSLSLRFPAESIRVNRPTVSIRFENAPDVEVAPAYCTALEDYYIPDPRSTGWIKSSPLKHKQYVNETSDEIPQVKKFVRLLKEWKYQQEVPISSLYIEMRAAKHARDNKPFLMLWDLAWFFRDLDTAQLPDMNDPSLFDGRRIGGPSSGGQKDRAMEQVNLAARATAIALDCHRNGQEELAVRALQILFQR
jgi:hypothetical protein